MIAKKIESTFCFVIFVKGGGGNMIEGDVVRVK
jgi:hypothetical protein